MYDKNFKYQNEHSLKSNSEKSKKNSKAIKRKIDQSDNLKSKYFHIEKYHKQHQNSIFKIGEKIEHM